MKSLVTITILLAAAYVVARPSATVSTFPVATPTTPAAPVEPSQVQTPTTVDAVEPGVVWYTSLALANEQAIKLRKRLLVRFTAPWCIPCAKHASADKERSVILNKFVCLKVNVDEEPKWRVSAKDKKSGRWRTVSVLDGRGIPYETIYDVAPNRIRAVWWGNPLNTPRYAKKLEQMSMRSVLITKEIR